MENTNEKEITLATLWAVLKKSFIVMIIAAVLLATIAAVYVAVFVKPTYRASATFWVNSSSSSFDYTSQAQTAAASAIASSCVELVKEDLPVRRAVEYGNLTEKLGYENDNESVRAIRKMISADKTNSNSFIFNITVNGESREEVYEIISAMQSVMPAVMDELIKLKENTNNSPLIAVIGPVNEPLEVKVVKTSAIKTFVLVGIITAILVYAVYFIISLFDTMVYDEKTLKENFSYPIVGTIPNWVNSNTGKRVKQKKRLNKDRHGVDNSMRDYSDRLLTAKVPFAINEAFNQLRTNIIFSAGGEAGSVIAVTSANSCAGKSLMSANLALSLSALGKRVLLVEGDMRCPSFHRIFGSHKEAGLSELLAGIESFSEKLVKKLPESNIDIVYSGKIPPNPSELLSSERMSGVIEAWKSIYDYIILDMPPICEVVDAGVISSVVNGYVLTVRCEYSDTSSVSRALDAIRGVNGKMFGFILNDYNPKKSGKHKRGYYNPETKYLTQENSL